MAETLAINPTTIVTTPLEGGSTSWTFATRLGEILVQAEAMFGERDRSWTLLGFEFRDNQPQTWFPGFRKHIVIQLGKLCLLEENASRGVFQLSHECIHLLSPVVGNASVLEEGLAAWYSTWYMREKMGEPNWTNGDIRYDRASELVGQLLAIDMGAIKKLRTFQPVISQIDTQLIVTQFPDFPSGVADQLAVRFSSFFQKPDSRELALATSSGLWVYYMPPMA